MAVIDDRQGGSEGLCSRFEAARSVAGTPRGIIGGRAPASLVATAVAARAALARAEVAMAQAIEEEDLSGALHALGLGVDPMRAMRVGKSPVGMAAAQGSRELLGMLMGKVRELDRPRAARDAVAEAARRGHADIVESMGPGALPEWIGDQGLTPAMESALRGCFKTVAVLVGLAGMAPAIDAFGRAELHCAALGGSLAVTRMLLGRPGADPWAMDACGRPALEAGMLLRDWSETRREAMRELLGAMEAARGSGATLAALMGIEKRVGERILGSGARRVSDSEKIAALKGWVHEFAERVALERAVGAGKESRAFARL